MKQKILLVEDEDHLLKTIKLNLELEGYDVVGVSNGRLALDEFNMQKPELIILDVMLPELSGFEVCERIRLKDKHTPILFLTAKGSSMEKIQGLKLGADDYLTKPFNLEEFLLRVQILLKRALKYGISDNYTFGGNEINFLTYEIKAVDGSIKTLSKREVLLLKLLIENKNKVVSRETILQNIWGEDVYPTTRTIDNYILAFRKYFEPDPREPLYFHSIRGVGYKFTF